MTSRLLALLLAFLSLSSLNAFSPPAVATAVTSSPHAQKWIDESLVYYNKIARGTPQEKKESPEHIAHAMRAYFAHTKVKTGKSHAAEKIYRNLLEVMLDETTNSEQDCDCELDHLAIPSLLLALLLQREKRPTDARMVFESFRQLVLATKVFKCSCSARVLQAYALFEMKQENQLKALDILFLAIRLDKNVRPVLSWKQFRDALAMRRRLLATRNVSP